MDRQTRLAMLVFLVIFLTLIALAVYGYSTGAWDRSF